MSSMIEAYLTQDATLIVTPRIALGESGTPVETAIKVLERGPNRLVKDHTGEQVLSSKTIFMAIRTLTLEDRIRLDDGQEYAILSIEKTRDFDPRYLIVRLI